jgi:hypothetical protein
MSYKNRLSCKFWGRVIGFNPKIFQFSVLKMQNEGEGRRWSSR